jgi:hypothetical protein
MGKVPPKKSTTKKAQRIKDLTLKIRKAASTRGGASLATQKLADGSVRFLPAVQTTFKK